MQPRFEPNRKRKIERFAYFGPLLRKNQGHLGHKIGIKCPAPMPASGAFAEQFLDGFNGALSAMRCLMPMTVMIGSPKSFDRRVVDARALLEPFAPCLVKLVRNSKSSVAEAAVRQSAQAKTQFAIMYHERFVNAWRITGLTQKFRQPLENRKTSDF